MKNLVEIEHITLQVDLDTDKAQEKADKLVATLKEASSLVGELAKGLQAINIDINVK